MKKIIYVFLMVIIGFEFISCKKGETKKEPSATVIWTLGDVTVMKNTVTEKLAPGGTVGVNDLVITGDKSFAAFQINEDIIYKMQPATKLRIANLADKKEKLNLESGKVISKIRKLSKDEEFIIITPTSIAAVRGTLFSVECNKEKSIIIVDSGKVAVSVNGKLEETPVEMNQAAELPAGKEVFEIRKSTDVESKIIKTIEAIPYSGSDKGVIVVPANQDSITAEHGKLAGNSAEATPGRLSFQELKAKYGRIDQVTLYNGKIIKGIITARGAMFTILTPDGEIKLPAKNVKTTKIAE